MTNNLWDIGGGGGDSFQFNVVGDQVTGAIVKLEEVQQTDIKTGELKTFDNGQPMMMYRVTLATQLRDANDPSDDGHRSIYLKGSKKSESQSSLAAVLDAVRAATGGTALEPNATLTLQYIGDGQASSRGFNPPKLYRASYQRAVMDLGGGAQAQAPASQPPTPPVQQSAYQAPPAPPEAAPAVQQAPAGPPQPSREQVAAVIAAGVDPKSVWPHYQG